SFMAPPQSVEDARSLFANAFRWCLERGRQTEWDAGVPAFASALRPTTMREPSHRCQAENTRYCGSNLGQSQDVEDCGKRCVPRTRMLLATGRCAVEADSERRPNITEDWVIAYLRRHCGSAPLPEPLARARFPEEITIRRSRAAWHPGCSLPGH